MSVTASKESARVTRRITGNLGDIIRRDLDPDRIALVDLARNGQAWTYRQLDDCAADMSAALTALGYPRGARIAILADNSAYYLCAYLGIMRAGMVAVPINVRFPATTISFVLGDCAASLVLAGSGYEGLVPHELPCVKLDDLFSNSRVRIAADIVEPETDEIAEILYTSGSTGRPKGVMLSHAGQRWAIGVHIQDKPTFEESALITAPMYHMNALFFIATAIANGVHFVLMPRFQPRAWLDAIAEFRCNWLTGIPTMFAMAARESDLLRSNDFDFVRRVGLGSAPLGVALMEEVRAMFPNATVTNGYGSTEAGPSIFGDHPAGLPRPMLSLGYPIKGVQWRLAGESQDRGELELRTPALFSGYVNLPSVFAEKVRSGWYATGDLMKRDENGFFFFAGRADDMFVCGGENVFPGDVEKMMERHPLVAQAAVVSVPDAIKGHIPIAFIVPKSGNIVSADDLKAFSLREGPAYSHPRAFVSVDKLPLSGTHKIDKQALLPQALEAYSHLGRR